jgi:hypothetical protein
VARPSDNDAWRAYIDLELADAVKQVGVRRGGGRGHWDDAGDAKGPGAAYKNRAH